MTDQQMELGLNGERTEARATRRERRVSRAQWWFDHMRQIVDRAFDWQTVPEARPEQIWLPGSRRQVEA